MDVDVRASMPGEALVYGSFDLERQNRALPCAAAPGRADRPEAAGWETLSFAMEDGSVECEALLERRSSKLRDLMGECGTRNEGPDIGVFGRCKFEPRLQSKDLQISALRHQASASTYRRAAF